MLSAILFRCCPETRRSVPSLLTGFLEEIAIFVAANAANINDVIWGKHVLRAAGGILCRSTGNQFGVVVLQELFVDAHVLLLGENSIVGLEAVLGQERGIAEALDV